MLFSLPPESKFTLFPIYSEDTFLTTYIQIGFPVKGNCLQIPKMTTLLTSAYAVIDQTLDFNKNTLKIAHKIGVKNGKWLKF